MSLLALFFYARNPMALLLCYTIPLLVVWFEC